MLLSKRKKTQFWGQVILAFGFIFLGLATMSQVMEPLKDVPAVTDFFVRLSTNPALAIMLGTVFTMAVQSSSASIGMVIALATVGLIDFRAALFLVLGDNIGTTITAWFASIGGTLSAKRMACFHSIFNIVGAAYFAMFVHMGIYPRFIDMITPGAVTLDTVARHIANAHSCFNIVNAIVFLFILGPIVRLIRRFVPGKDIYVSTDFKYLQDKLLLTPEIAVESAKKELVAMAEMVQKTIKTAIDGFFQKDKKSIPHVETQEGAIDHLQHDITYYLAKLTAQELTPDLAVQLPPLLHSINDFERVSDHAVNIAELTDKIYSDELPFSNKAQAEMRMLYSKLEDMFDALMRAMKGNDSEAIDKVMQIEGVINLLQKEYLANHSQRLCDRKCNPHSALVFVDFVNNIEKVADHLTNVAQAVRAGFVFNGDERSGGEPALVES